MTERRRALSLAAVVDSINLACVVVSRDWLSLVPAFFYSPPPGGSFSGIKRESRRKRPSRNEIYGGGVLEQEVRMRRWSKTASPPVSLHHRPLGPARKP
uniref:Putative uncharacterized protein LOC644613 n=1 Tax=Homo sapiens TaxID=9606 RepID=YK045_HUMAN|nr:RecName: Full=Putative uncharacterized protein LOC644613; Flags: Precursor [Homo sapiens]